MGLLSSLVKRSSYARGLQSKLEELKAHKQQQKEDIKRMREDIRALRKREGNAPPVSLSYAGEMRAALDTLLTSNAMVQSIPHVQEVAQRLNLVVSDKDIMLKKSTAQHYLSTGFSALDSIYQCLPHLATQPPGRVLDFGCGYGRVLRMLRAAWPHNVTFTCDLMADGLSFCMEHFDVAGYRSQIKPSSIPLAHGFDLIWVGSVITHLDEDAIMGYISLFRHLLEPGGSVVLTTGGEKVITQMEQNKFHYDLTPEQRAAVIAGYRKDGFAYCDYPNMKGYGISAIHESWLRPRIEALGRLEITKVMPAQWDNHQDVWCIRKL